MTQIRQYKSGKFYRDEFRGNLSWNGNEHNVLLRGRGKGADGNLQFADVAMAMGADDIKDARGMAIADFDNDGDYDIVVNTNPGDCGKKSMPPVLLRNDIGQSRNWLAIKLIGTESNRDAIGAEVTLRGFADSGEVVQMLRHVTAGGGYASQNSDRIYFGLGSLTQIDSVTVRWPSGTSLTYREVESNQILYLREDDVEQHSASSRLSIGVVDGFKPPGSQRSFTRSTSFNP
ncbi:MAG: ASPIC/UnbV domain-containing protein [Pirellula sp.]